LVLLSAVLALGDKLFYFLAVFTFELAVQKKLQLLNDLLALLR